MRKEAKQASSNRYLELLLALGKCGQGREDREIDRQFDRDLDSTA
jgi:hypothetical protein